MPNGIDLILADHERVRALFRRFSESPDADSIGQVLDLLAAHDAAEHAALYPLVGRLLDDPAVIERASVAHSAVKKQIEHIKALEGPPLVDGFEELRGLVEQHVADEEGKILPELAARATPEQLEGLGARILQAKQRGG